MWGDSAHAPFLHGVASGDPTQTGLIIWTRLSPGVGQAGPQTVSWEIALDTAFAQTVQNGTFITDASMDWTVKLTLDNLSPGTRYFYRFSDTQNRFSAIGRTKTFASGGNGSRKIAIGSCSSVYSGFFNAYRRIAERGDLDLMVHLGDYVYDFVDENEEVRVPVPYPAEPATLAEWRERHKYYLFDPDLREMRRLQPLSAIWDNHDVLSDTIAHAVRAFWEYLPIRQPDPADPMKVYRTLQMGSMADFFLLDVDLYRRQDTLAPGETSILGNIQYDWLTDGLSQSTARWRIIGSQCMFSLWSVLGLPPLFPAGQTVFDPSAWDGFQLDRTRLLQHIGANNIQNCMVISGDAHISMAADLAISPLDSMTYDSASGYGSLGVEFLPSSITRGNLDESGISPNNANGLAQLSVNVNPHHHYMEVVQHGYGLLTIRPDSIVAEFWYSPILQVSNSEILGRRMVVRNGENRWAREYLPTGLAAPAAPRNLSPVVYPNPVSNNECYVKLPEGVRGEYSLRLVDPAGRLIFQQQHQAVAGSDAPIYLRFPAGLPAGSYLLHFSNAQGQGASPLLIK
jgi:alkaline phosphatase D